ncbi:GspE/PulE family protein [Candidatus Pelagibacter bacterium]|nr:GspE/PulE family protein [Candidatus Pelagibacter bacterium]MDA9624963.1 GspE/PulE family protein [Candidatus Pelagibacter bacterium]
MLKLNDTSEQSILNMLVEHKSISSQQLKQIETLSNEGGKTKLETSFELNITNPDKILTVLADSYSLPKVELKKIVITDKIKQLAALRYLRENIIVPFEFTSEIIKVAIPDSSKLGLIKNIKNITQLEPELYASSLTEIDNFYKRLENRKNSEELRGKKLEVAKKTEENVPIEVGSEVIVFGDKLIKEAITSGASDIHIEPFKDSAQVRFRIDGVLVVMEQFTKFLEKNYNAVVTRIKIISKLDIAERRMPQDGGSTFKLDKKEIDLRISILPTKNNERIVMRILNKDEGAKSLDALGFKDEDLTNLTEAINSPQGMVLVTGPTGSGKTTTLYTILQTINKPSLNILTAEDPVEYELEGVGQVQVREDIGYTFESALRSFLRQDPEVILVGEIRDKATVDIALKAALTGHLVFSTIHTNDAPSTITRLQNMGTPDYLISAACSLIIAQRLARKTCSDCRVPDEKISPKVLISIGFTDAEASRVKPVIGGGCENCNPGGKKTRAGYKGRMGIYEILKVTKNVKSAILRKATTQELKEAALKDNFRTMQDMGREMILTGDLSFEEYQRVLATE